MNEGTNFGPMGGGPETYGVRIQMLETHMRDMANATNNLIKAMADRRVEEMELRGQVTASVLASSRAANMVEKLTEQFGEHRDELRDQIDKWRRELNGRVGKAESEIGELKGKTHNMICLSHAEEFADNKKRLEVIEGVLEDVAPPKPRKLVQTAKSATWTIGSIGGLFLILEQIWSAGGKELLARIFGK